MKILYAVQGTGNGHISRALEIVPLLQKKAEVDVLISGSQWELKLPFEVKYRFKGMGFVFGKKGGVDMLKTYMEMNSIQLMKEIRSLPVEDYDLIISDFEPVSSWACYMKNKVCVGLSNQVATLHPMAPKPKSNDHFGKMILKHYAPATYQYGYHFMSLDSSVYTPVIRKEVREAEITNEGHITVYLPSYDDEIILHRLRHYKKIKFQVFSKHIKSTYIEKNFKIFPLNNEHFIKSMSSSNGVICNAGFGAASEALYLGKKLMVIPMKTQFEQSCNAAVLKSLGVTVIKSLKKKHFETICGWLSEGTSVPVNYPDRTEEILDKIISRHAGQSLGQNSVRRDFSFFKNMPVNELQQAH